MDMRAKTIVDIVCLFFWQSWNCQEIEGKFLFLSHWTSLIFHADYSVKYSCLTDCVGYDKKNKNEMICFLLCFENDTKDNNMNIKYK